MRENFLTFTLGHFSASDLLDRLFTYVNVRRPFHIDDVYVGIGMRDLKVDVTKINSFRIQDSMTKFIRTVKDCEMLGYSAFGHSIDPQSARELHRRLQSHLCKNITLKC